MAHVKTLLVLQYIKSNTSFLNAGVWTIKGRLETDREY